MSLISFKPTNGFCDRKITMATQRSLHPDLRIHENVKLHGKRELMLQMDLSLLVSWSSGKINTNCPAGSNIITNVFKNGRGELAGKPE
jgi:hypothetical protein